MQWPTTVPILGMFQTISNRYGSPYEEGYPTDLIAWTEYALPDHETRVVFWRMYYRVNACFDKYRFDMLSIMDIKSELEHVAKWNTRIRILWNTTMILLDYTENQSDRALKVAHYLASNNFFQKLDVVVGCRNGIYYPVGIFYDNVQVTVNKIMTIDRREFNAEEETSTTEYATRPAINRTPNSPRKIHKPRRPTNKANNKSNLALKRLMQADGA